MQKESLWEQAQAAYCDGEYSQAEKYYNRLISEEPQNLHARIERQIIFQLQERREEAIQDLEHILKETIPLPESPSKNTAHIFDLQAEAYHWLAILHTRPPQDWEKALLYLDESIRVTEPLLDLLPQQALDRLSSIYMQRAQIFTAAENMEHFALYELSRLFIILDLYEGEDFCQPEILHRERQKAYLLQGELHERKEQFFDATASYLNAGGYEGYKRAGTLSYNLGKTRRAGAYFRRALHEEHPLTEESQCLWQILLGIEAAKRQMKS